jgi:hypothetical protein
MEERAAKYPMVAEMTLHSCKQMLLCYKLPPQRIITEMKLAQPYILPSGRRVVFRGKVDGIFNNQLWEHKCKSYCDPRQTAQELPYDLQVNLYAHLTSCYWVQYDVILVPDFQYKLPKRHSHQSMEDYVKHIYLHHAGDNYPIKSKSSLWIFQIQLDLDPDQIAGVFHQTVVPIAERMWEWYEHVTSPNFSIEDPDTWGSVMYRQPVRHFDAWATDSYKSDYWDFLVGNQDPEDLQPAHLFSELEDE